MYCFIIMIEFLSNFYLKNKLENEDLPDDVVIYNTNDNIITIVNDYKNFKSIVIVYSCKDDILYFLSTFSKQICNIKSKNEFEDLLLMNGLIFM
jgi:hypothetical protein